MIVSFCNQGTEDIFQRVESRESRQVLPSTLHHIAARKLALLNAARFVDGQKTQLKTSVSLITTHKFKRDHS